ncbi:uncharacterized protein LOC120270321 [Dioscorea cayenensis subsp. rotundata]|uniref:Uncharacterized protein LOC120270321 n=1 Tax=Dioscorea cayennensis subsp. rotundata TaxID=55577 RepID=A0AB40C0M1_DIOCR|nr:uncharacterized protein LOC120270321 [Dioscorea cayenensis subsp. rotundata]
MIEQALEQKKLVPNEDTPQRSKVPFVKEIMVKPLPKKFKMPQLTTYSGKGDPYDPMQNYEAVMLLHGWEDAIMCRVLPFTLTEHARIWFNNMKEGSISNFNQLRKELIDEFFINARRKKDASYLLTIKQEEKERMKDYVERFRAAILEVQDLQATVAILGMLQQSRSRDFQKSLSLDQPLTLGDLFSRAKKFTISENVMRHINAGNRDKKRKDRDETNNEGRKTGSENEHRQVPKLKFENFTPLSQPHSTILASIEGPGLLTFPLKANKTMGKFTDAYWRFHKTLGHSTDRCRELMNEIESLVRQGKLNKFVYSEAWRNGKLSYSKKERSEDNKGMNDKKDSKTREKTPTLDNNPSHPAIHVIIGGETLAGETSSSRKVTRGLSAWQPSRLLRAALVRNHKSACSRRCKNSHLPKEHTQRMDTKIREKNLNSLLIEESYYNQSQLQAFLSLALTSP